MKSRIGILLLLLAASVCQAAVLTNMPVRAIDSVSQNLANRYVTLTPTDENYVYNGLVSAEPVKQRLDSNAETIFTNVVLGYYTLDLASSPRSRFYLHVDVSTNSLNVTNFIEATEGANGIGTAYSKAQADGRFVRLDYTNHGDNVLFDARGLDGNLTPATSNLLQLAQAVDDLSIGSFGLTNINEDADSVNISTTLVVSAGATVQGQMQAQSLSLSGAIGANEASFNANVEGGTFIGSFVGDGSGITNALGAPILTNVTENASTVTVSTDLVVSGDQILFGGDVELNRSAGTLTVGANLIADNITGAQANLESLAPSAGSTMLMNGNLKTSGSLAVNTTINTSNIFQVDAAGAARALEVGMNGNTYLNGDLIFNNGSVSGIDTLTVGSILGDASGLTNMIWFDVTDYGADGSDSTVDITGIRAATAAAEAAGGGVVYFPAGTYLVDGTTPDNSYITHDGTAANILIYSNNIHFLGDGPGATVIQRTTGTPSRNIINSFLTTNISFRGITFDANNSAYVDNVTAFYTNRYVTVENCEFKNHSGGGWDALEMDAEGVIIRGCTFTNIAANALAVDGTAGSARAFISDCFLYYCGYNDQTNYTNVATWYPGNWAAIQLRQGDFLLNNIQTENCPTSLQVLGTRLWMNNCVFDGTGNANTNIYVPQGTVIMNNVEISDVGAGGCAVYGGALQSYGGSSGGSGSDLTMNNCRITASQGFCVIATNRLALANSRLSTTSAGDAIILEGGTGHSIKGCYISNNGQQAILGSGTVSKSVFSDNYIVNASTYFSGGGYANVFSGNVFDGSSSYLQANTVSNLISGNVFQNGAEVQVATGSTDTFCTGNRLAIDTINTVHWTVSNNQMVRQDRQGTAAQYAAIDWIGNVDAVTGESLWDGKTIVYQDHTQHSHTGDTTETTLASFTLPGGSLGANGSLTFYIHVSSSGAGGTQYLRVYLGATQIGATWSLGDNQQAGIYRVLGNRNSESSQICFAATTTLDPFQASGAAAATTSIDTSGDLTFAIKGQNASSGSDTVSVESYRVEVNYAQ